MINQIKQYYLLCTINHGIKKHIMDDIDQDIINKLFTTKELNNYLRSVNNHYIAREFIVGGATDDKSN